MSTPRAPCRGSSWGCSGCVRGWEVSLEQPPWSRSADCGSSTGTTVTSTVASHAPVTPRSPVSVTSTTTSSSWVVCSSSDSCCLSSSSKFSTSAGRRRTRANALHCHQGTALPGEESRCRSSSTLPWERVICM